MVRKIRINEDLDKDFKTITFKLRYRDFSELSKEALDILDRYRQGSMDYLEAHNALIRSGFNLLEDNVIVDY